MINPLCTIAKVVGSTQTDFDAATLAVVSYFKAHDDKQQIPDDEIRAVHPALKSDLVWNEVKKALGV